MIIASRYLLATLIAISACASAPRASQTSRPQRDVLTRAEIQEIPGRGDLLQAIRSLRPHFLTRPPGVQPGAAKQTLLIIVDGVRSFDMAALRGINASAVDEVRYLDPGQAAAQYGEIGSGGALVIKMYDSSRSKRDTLSPGELGR